MSERLKYERFLWFHGRVKAGQYPNAKHLVEEFEISDRTAQRDVDFMRDRLFAPLYFDHSRRGYRYTDTSFELPGHWISETNVLALALAVRLASTIPDPALKDELCCLINRVVNTSGGAGESCIDRVGDKISVKNIEYARVDERVFRQTVQALFEDQALRITYHSPHSGCSWLQYFGKDKIFVGAPAPRDIAEAAFGIWREGKIIIDEKLKKATIERLLPCIVDGAMIPRDLVDSCVRRVSSRHSFPWKWGQVSWEWEKALGIACALYRKSNEKEEYRMALDENRTTRDYLYGRLLALAENLEHWALRTAGENRPTNAERLMQRFADHR